MSEVCRHPVAAVAKGPRCPTRWGSWPTEVCGLCGYYRLDLPFLMPRPQWEKGPVPKYEDYDE